MGHDWSLRGGVRITLLRGALLSFEFEDGFDGEIVLSRGVKRLKETVLHLDRSKPGGRVLSKRCARHGSVGECGGAPSLQLHLWSRKVLKKIEDTCEALVRLDGRRMPGMLKVVVGLSCFSISCVGKYNHSFLLRFRVVDFLV